MTSFRLTRRQFLRLSSLSMLAIAARPLPPDEAPTPEVGLGRVAAARVTIRTEPNSDAEKVDYRWEDTIINLRALVEGSGPPDHNKLWYQVAGGYVHSGYILPVKFNVQKPLTVYHGEKFLVEVSVPFTDARRGPGGGTEHVYRHYYGTTHWANAIHTDDFGRTWYRIPDDKWHFYSYILGSHLRPVAAHELTPLSPTVTDKLLEVNIATQTVHAYEDGHEVFSTRAATGDFHDIKGVLKDFTTPAGKHIIERKTPSRHMAASDLAAGEGYDLPGVPWVSYFTASGVAFHGTYWHNDYGRKQSHGCVNVTSENAKWIYRWSLPLSPVNEDYVWENGTKVIVV